jgi:hypothetical protein
MTARFDARRGDSMAKPVHEASGPPDPGGPQPFDAEIAAERRGWFEILGLVKSLDGREVLDPGYYPEAGWSVADVVAHLGTWLAEAGVQLERIKAGTYEPRELDIDAMNAQFRAAMQGQPWSVVLGQARAARIRMLRVWSSLTEPSEAAAWWVAKAGAEHYDEHLGRLREWVTELQARRFRSAAPPTPVPLPGSTDDV